MNLDIHLLRVFLAVYETHSVGRSAQLLDMSQPGLSTALRRLRGLLDDPLFVKTYNGMEPTSRARELLAPIRGIVQAVDNELFAVPLFDPASSAREFRLSLTDIGEGIYLPFIVQAIEKAAPSISLRSTYLPPREMEEAMAAGDVDLACGYFPDLTSSQFLHRRIGLHSFACIMRADHPIRDAALTMAQYISLDHVEVEAPGRSLEVFENFLQKKKLRRKVVLRTPHFMSIPVIVGSTDVVATVPQALADFFASMKELRQVRLPFRPPTFQVNMYWHRGQTNDPGNQWLRQVIVDQLETLKARAYHRSGK
ncbi:LysR family transcriptional regulator [Pigmentiphaga litoralis]|uniref:LysR family transcriptional regulator n=1 Tax=Pigmentiphaga litoralis TaxID=516702 RepID=UPI00167248B0|nr:LysR family transcriptional regulator [Pigmentiphaga litoralis]GGX23721.1 LysR family transcriptional regulator [Pigmentiphaga litoralis]